MRDSNTPGQIDLEPLFRPGSIAVVGASPNPSISRNILDTLKAFGFAGHVYPVNPKYEAIGDLPCFPSLRDLPGAPDVVAFCVSHERTLEGFRQLPEIGARAAVIFGGGFGEAGEWGRSAQAEIVQIAREHGIALCGPNCMGVISPHARSATYLQNGSSADAITGNVGLISQSGSICISMLADVSRFGFSLVASTGNEAVVSSAAVLDYMVDHDETRIIAIFNETISEPERFVAALDRAAEAGKPVVVLKVGKNERTREAIATHTGGVAGDERVFSEVLRAHRAIEVTEFDELVEVLAAFQATRLPEKPAISVVTSSGGVAELMLDNAASNGIELPPLPDDEFEEAQRVIGAFSGDGNPLDAWGNGNFRVNTPHALGLVGQVANTGSVVLSYDNNDGAPMGNIADYLARIELLEASQKASSKPHYQLSFRPGLRIAEQTERLRALGIPTLSGIRPGLGAIKRLATWNTFEAPERQPIASADSGDEIVIAGRVTVNEHDSKRVMASHGLRTTREELAATPDEAAEAAGRIGFPVVLKAVSDAIPHKSDLGLVIVGIETPAELAEAWKKLTERLENAGAEAGILVQEMVRGGLEVFAGVAHHPGFGHFLAFGLGGVEVELQDDVALRKLPLREGDAEKMIGEIRGASRFEAYRGRPAYDTESLATCLYAISDLVTARGDVIREIDLNPIKLMPAGQGLVIVDALVLPMKKEAGENS